MDLFLLLCWVVFNIYFTSCRVLMTVHPRRCAKSRYDHIKNPCITNRYRDTCITYTHKIIILHRHLHLDYRIRQSEIYTYSLQEDAERRLQRQHQDFQKLEIRKFRRRKMLQIEQLQTNQLREVPNITVFNFPFH